MNRLSVVIIVICAAAWSVPIWAESVKLVEDGRPIVTIVMPAETEAMRYESEASLRVEAHFARVAERRSPDWIAAAKPHALAWISQELSVTGDEAMLAAQELQSVLRQVSGAELAIVSSDDTVALAETSGGRILLGAALARQAGLSDRLDSLDEFGFLCVARGDDLILAGKRDRGTLYAVYHFLESIGCRWVMPGEFGELYPSLSTISTGIDVMENPDHRERYWWCSHGVFNAAYPQWTLRMKGNYIRALGEPKVVQGHAWDTILAWGAQHSDFRVQNEAGDWTLPDDFYAQVDGKPFHGAPNFSNPKAQGLFADYLIDFFDRYPQHAYASLSATDGIMRDDHTASQGLSAREFDFAQGAHSSTDMIWHFLNNVIERVGQVYPQKKIAIYVYASNMTPPRIEQVNPQTALVFAPLSICPIHAIEDDRCKTNGWYKNWLNAWMTQKRAVNAEAYLYDYEPMGYSWNKLMLCPRWPVIARNYKLYHELGLDGHTTEGFDSWLSAGLDHYVMMRLYWNVDAALHTIIADYCDARFGSASSAMQAYYRVYEDRMAEIPDLTGNENWGNHLVLTPEVRAMARMKLEKAVADADTERAKVHVENLVEIQASTDAFCDGIELARETGDFAAAALRMEDAFDIAEKLNELYPNFVFPLWLQHRPSVSYHMSGGVYDLYRQAAERVSKAKVNLVLPRYWWGGLDTDNTAVSKSWHSTGFDPRQLDKIDTTLIPDVVYQTQRQPAAFFYRCDVEVSQSFREAERINLYFPALIARAVQIWVNGERVVFETSYGRDKTWRGPDYFWFNYDHQKTFDLTAHIKPGQKNTIAVRVFRSFDHGGSYQRPYLLGESVDATR